MHDNCCSALSARLDRSDEWYPQVVWQRLVDMREQSGSTVVDTPQLAVFVKMLHSAQPVKVRISCIDWLGSEAQSSPHAEEDSASGLTRHDDMQYLACQAAV